MDFFLNCVFTTIGLIAGTFLGATIGYNAAIDKVKVYLKTVHGIEWSDNGTDKQ